MDKINRIAAIAFAIVVLFSAICIPAAADYVDWNDYKIASSSPSAANEPAFNSMTIVSTSESSSLISDYAYSSSSPTYYFAYPSSGTADTYRIIVTGTEPFTLYKMKRNTRTDNGKKTYANYNSVEATIGQYNLYSANFNEVFTSVNCTTFDTIGEGYESFHNWLENPPGPAENPVPFSYNVGPGYALFVDIHGLTGVSGILTTTTTKAFASPHTSNQTLSYQSSIPAGNVSPQGNSIDWSGTGNKDVFGRYKSWSRTLIINPNSSYIAIYNPVHVNTYLDPEHEDYNGSIHVSVSQAYASTSILVPLNTELTASGQVGTTTTEDHKPLEYDPDNDLWYPTNQDGTPYTPSPYGDYMPSTVNSVNDWLQNIAHQISGFFSGAIGAVTNLVNAGSAFIHQLISLYSWLPAPVYAVLSSALILVITIGVIKVFI